MNQKNIREALANLGLHEVDERSWCFEYPRLSYDIVDEFDDAYDLARVGRNAEAERAIAELARKYPEFIDAHHHLALIYSRRGENERAFRLWQSAVELGLSAFPSTFCFGRDRMRWAHLENRPFMRAYHALGLAYFERGLYGEAYSIFRNLLALNPLDNQGARDLVVNSLFRLRRPLDVLKFCKRHRDLADPSILYGRVLAHYWLGDAKEADSALAEAVRHRPLVAQEIAKERHRRPKDMRDGYVTMGGADEAYVYWEDFGASWKQIDGAIKFVQKQKYVLLDPPHARERPMSLVAVK